MNYTSISVWDKKPSEDWTGFVFTEHMGNKYKKICTYFKDADIWKGTYDDLINFEYVTHWMEEDKFKIRNGFSYAGKFYEWGSVDLKNLMEIEGLKEEHKNTVLGIMSRLSNPDFKKQ